MTDTDTPPETQGKVPTTLLEDYKDERSGTDIDSKTEPSSEVSDNTHVSSDENDKDNTMKEPEPPAAETTAGSKSHPPLHKTYGPRWSWDAEAKDYIPEREGGTTIRYREYQRTGGKLPSTTVPPAPSGPSSQPPKSAAQASEPPPSDSPPHEQSSVLAAEKEPEKEAEDGCVKLNRNERGSISSEKSLLLSPNLSVSNITPRQPAPRAPPKAAKEYQEPLDKGFTPVDKPKRFFQPGRIFATTWFEPAGHCPSGRKADLEWTDVVPPYHGETPIAKFRWFIVARKRLHHSLCFNITTVGPNGPRRADRGRGMDFVVLHSSNVEPSTPFEVEGITKDPIGVIIEAGDESISPWARLDCGRIYTVEDNLRVMKIGRVHMGSLELLEEYFRLAVA